MIRIAFCIAALFAAILSNAQGVYIAATPGTPDASAILDADASDKGILVPRMTSANRTSIATPAAGLLVYDTDEESFWYYDGAAWKEISKNGASWSLTGNAGTTPGSDFIGTTDNQSFDLRTNNALKLRIRATGQLETFNTGRSVFIGEGAGIQDDLSTNSNVFVGYTAGTANTTGSSNAAIGPYALYTNISGSANVAAGDGALFSNTIGDSNTSIGFQSMFGNTKGYNNVAMGWYAMRNSTTAVNNVAIGFRSLSVQDYSNGNNIWNSFNTAVGGYTLENTKSTATGNGIGNTAVGHWALQTNTTGSYNTALGYNALNTGSTWNNCTAVGTDANIDANNQIRLGNNSISSFKCQVGLTVTSDGRVKKDIREDVKGLDFILRLRPVTYHYDVAAENKLMGVKEDITWPGKYEIESIRFSGFIAQEVEEAALQSGYSFSGVDKSGEVMGLRYSDFTVPIVQALQELNERVMNLEKENTELRALIASGQPAR